MELQLTCHGYGAFFSPHSDASRQVNSQREVSFVYYFRLSRQGFSGGDLRLFDGSFSDLRFSTEAFTTVEPEDDSLVLFPSRCAHEVTPIRAPSKELVDGRFSLNGWIHRQETWPEMRALQTLTTARHGPGRIAPKSVCSVTASGSPP